MPDVFISYSREDAETAQRMAEILEQQGLTAFWDRDIPPGSTWDQHIGKALGNTRCVVVLWSSVSVESDWVKEEASRGQARNLLVPVMIEQVQPPLGFGRIEAADLSAWRGDPGDPEFALFLESIRSNVEKGRAKTGSEPPEQPRREPPPRRPRLDPAPSASADGARSQALVAAKFALIALPYVVAALLWGQLSGKDDQLQIWKDTLTTMATNCSHTASVDPGAQPSRVARIQLRRASGDMHAGSP
jgi:hypothetical protein